MCGLGKIYGRVWFRQKDDDEPVAGLAMREQFIVFQIPQHDCIRGAPV